MKIFEILIFEHEEGLFSKFAQGIPIKILDNYDFPVYRLEVDPSFVIILYIFEINNEIPIYFLENIIPSLKRIIWLSREQNFRELTPPANYRELIEKNEHIIPSAVILSVGEDNLLKMSEILLYQGCYLGDQSRLYLWNDGDQQNSRQIWQLIWSVHETPLEIAEIPDVQ
jgi:hypothetical protein